MLLAKNVKNKTTLKTMKKLILTFAFIGAITASQAQTVKRDGNGNFYKTQTVKKDSTTAHTYTDGKGAKHKVYKSKNGKYYIARISKNGNFYRQYLKPEE